MHFFLHLFDFSQIIFFIEDKMINNFSNSRVAGFREMIREAGSDFWEVIPGHTKLYVVKWKKYILGVIEIYKNRLKV